MVGSAIGIDVGGLVMGQLDVTGLVFWPVVGVGMEGLMVRPEVEFHVEVFLGSGRICSWSWCSRAGF